MKKRTNSIFLYRTITIINSHTAILLAFVFRSLSSGGFFYKQHPRRFKNIIVCCLIVTLNFKFSEIKNQLLRYSLTATEEGKEKVFPTYVVYKEILSCQQQLYRYSFCPIFYRQTLKN